HSLGSVAAVNGGPLASGDDDAGPFLDRTDAAQEQVLRLERCLERWALLLRKRHEQPTSRLRVVAERVESLRDAGGRYVSRRKVAVARIAARAHALAREIKRAVDRRGAIRLER